MKKDNLSFEEALSRLEEISSKLDSGKIGLEESISLYEQGSELLGYCEKLLDVAEQKVNLLKINSDGSLEETEFDGAK